MESIYFPCFVTVPGFYSHLKNWRLEQNTNEGKYAEFVFLALFSLTQYNHIRPINLPTSCMVLFLLTAEYSISLYKCITFTLFIHQLEVPFVISIFYCEYRMAINMSKSKYLWNKMSSF